MDFLDRVKIFIDDKYEEHGLIRDSDNFDVNKKIQVCIDNNYYILGSVLFRIHGLVNKSIRDFDIYARDHFDEDIDGFDNINKTGISKLGDFQEGDFQFHEGIPVISLEGAVKVCFLAKLHGHVLNMDNKHLAFTSSGLYLLELAHSLKTTGRGWMMDFISKPIFKEHTLEDDFSKERYANLVQRVIQYEHS